MKNTAQTENVTNETIASGRYERVMLIDDNSMDNFINKRLIESCEFASDIIVCSSGKEALEYFNSGQDLPSLIFLDINMPEMNGFEFLESFETMNSEIHNQCKVLMLSTSESFKDLNKANKNRFVKKFLNKPLTVDVLKAIKI
jgi:CheY-like chemotaxis protein